MMNLNTIRQESNSSEEKNNMYADPKCCGGCSNKSDFKYQFTKKPASTENNDKDFIGISQKHGGPNCELAQTLTSFKAVEAKEPAPGISAEEQFQAYRPAGKKQMHAVPEEMGQTNDKVHAKETLKPLVGAQKINREKHPVYVGNKDKSLQKSVGRKKSSFDKVLDARIVKTREILKAKEKEYAADGDRFHNFRVAARMENKTPEQALYGMMLKHMVSVKDLVEWTESDPEKITIGLIDEKIGDHLNFLILLEGLLLERINENEHKTTLTAGLE